MKPNIFIIGMTKTGKTPLAQSIASQAELIQISASDWVKQRFVPSEAASNDHTLWLQEITEFSCRELARDPHACIDYLRRTCPLQAGGYVIDGIRNPYDFNNLFRPEFDMVIFLHFEQNQVVPTAFEREGVSAIRQCAEWLRRMQILHPTRMKHYRLDALRGQLASGRMREDIPGPRTDEPCWSLDEVMIWSGVCVRHVLQTMAVAPLELEVSQTGLAHVEIPAIRAWVERRVLYDDDPAYEGWIPCSIFALSSYPGTALTCQVLQPDGSVFSYVPMHRLRHTDPTIRRELSPRLPLSDLVYHDCRAPEISVTRFEVLSYTSCRVCLRSRGELMNARYLMTIDWYTGNDLLHLIALENGQFAALPSHKVLFGGDAKTWPRYKKLHADWSVGQ